MTATSGFSAAASGVDASPFRNPAWEFLGGRLPVEDWTEAARRGRIEAVVRTGSGEAVREQMARALHRDSQGHLLITGEKGVGKTALVRELARRAAGGDVVSAADADGRGAGGEEELSAGRSPYAFLSDRRFLWVDCRHVGPEDSRACFETILSVCDDGAEVVLCLDGLGPLLTRPQGGTNRPLLLAAASRPNVRIIGILGRREYHDLIGGDAEILDRFTRLDVDEPGEEETLAIARQAAARLQNEFALELDDAVIERAVALCGTFLLSAARPAGVIRVLRRCCEEADYDRRVRHRPRARLETADVIAVLSELTGIPATTLSGEGGTADFEAALREAVVGQEEAVRQVATELRLIKSGLSEPGKPAAVLLFAGMTGVGKTELAKRLAELYSTSRRLQTYTMGNFTEPHSVSGIIGVPPGYVGHDLGGRLINELNADPYAVFLLDEAEKAHPNVMKPFLNLFDEGWIVDQRGVKAYADRAIFVLTTNAGDRVITQMTAQGKPDEEIARRVQDTLSKLRQERSAQPVFTPQFLARIGRILVFRPLDEAAMTGITRKLLARMQDLWRRKRQKEITLPEPLITALARSAHRRNEQASGREGGRIVRKLIADHIESAIQHAATTAPDRYRTCHRIVLSLADDAPVSTSVEQSDADTTASVEPGEVIVTFE